MMKFVDGIDLSNRFIIITKDGIDVRFHNCNLVGATIIAANHVDFVIAGDCMITGLTIVATATVDMVLDGGKIPLRNSVDIRGIKLKHGQKMFVRSGWNARRKS